MNTSPENCKNSENLKSVNTSLKKWRFSELGLSEIVSINHWTVQWKKWTFSEFGRSETISIIHWTNSEKSVKFTFGERSLNFGEGSPLYGPICCGGLIRGNKKFDYAINQAICQLQSL